MEVKIPLSFAIFVVWCFTLTSAFEERNGPRDKVVDGESDMDLDKRLYDYGKRPYHYVTEYKRLPLYNFGLGKRSPRYNFGLGKRHMDEEESGNEYEDYPFVEVEDAEPEVYFDDDIITPEKRQRLYSFGLGKRLPKYDFGLGKRAGPYDFGLGKRTQRFNFGLGKRNGIYSFGLGKKATDTSNIGNRFSFGLGKRSADADSDSDRVYVAKREISSREAEDNYNKNDTDGHAGAPAKQNGLAHDLEKRSKTSDLNVNGFSRRFRKPLSYNFGLGKRRPLYDFGLGKRNYQSDVF